jgi:hypothetical protein
MKMSIKHRILANKENDILEVSLTPLKAIRWKCLECHNFNPLSVRVCNLKTCALFKYRFGRNPAVKNKLNADQKKRASERLKKKHKKRVSDPAQK